MPKELDKKTIFLTGGTGFLGSYLLKILLDRGNKVYALSRELNGVSANLRIEKALGFWNHNAAMSNFNNLVIIEGDITKDGIGIEESILESLAQEVEEIFHCAAETHFNASSEQLKEVNIEGTKKILEFGLGWEKTGKLKKINHISSVYVCGDYGGTFTENDLNVGQKFNTPYEQSKFEAELLVADFRKKGLWVDVFRPPAIIGESVVGKTPKFDHVYQLLRLWNQETLDVFPIKKASLNLSSVDLVAEAIYRISVKSDTHNKNYHLFGDRPISTVDFFDIAKKRIGFNKPERVEWNYDLDKISASNRLLTKKSLLFNIICLTKIDSGSTLEILDKLGFHFPQILSEDIEKMIEYCFGSGFIKRKKQ